MSQQTETSSEHVRLIDAAIQEAKIGPIVVLGGKVGRGLSTSTLYQIVAEDHHYIIRITAPNDHHNDLPHEHMVLQRINPLGIAPHSHYVNVKTGIAIADFIAGQTLLPWTPDRPAFLPMLAKTVRTLHDGPALPAGDSIFDKATTAIGKLPPAFQATPLVTNATALFTPLEPFLRDPAYLRPIHGDLNPGNMLFDGRKLWFVDWTEAQQDNFYFDLACCSHFFFHGSEEQQIAFLHAYFDRPPRATELHNYGQMLVFCALYYGLVFLYLSGLQGTTVLAPAEIALLPDYATMLGRFGSGVEQIDDAISQQRMGFVCLQRALTIWAFVKQQQ